MTVGDLLLLQSGAASIAAEINKHVSDKERQQQINGMQYGYLSKLALLILATRNWQNFRGGPEQTPVEAYFNAKPEPSLAFLPEWIFEVTEAITNDSQLDEGEEGN